MPSCRLSALLVLATFVWSLPVAGEGPPSGEKLFAPALQPFVDQQTLAGAVTLVVDSGQVLNLETVGHADLAGKKPMRKDSVFWIASMSKPMTATAIMMLVDEGKLELDDPVEKFLPEFKNLWLAVERDEEHMLLQRPKRPINIRDLLTHTSGLVHFLEVENPGSKEFELLPLKVAARYYALTPLHAEPGSKWQYSNAGLNTAGRVVEVVSGVPYEEFMRCRLFAPLGMADTTFSPTLPQLKRLATSYKPNATGTGLEATAIPILKYPLDGRTNTPFPAGGLFSTADDVGRFCQLFLNLGVVGEQRVLSERAVREMTSKHAETPGGQAVGLGWFIEADGIYGHTGAYNTRMQLDSSRGLAKVFLVQHAAFNENGEKVFNAFDQVARERYHWGRREK